MIITLYKYFINYNLICGFQVIICVSFDIEDINKQKIRGQKSLSYTHTQRDQGGPSYPTPSYCLLIDYNRCSVGREQNKSLYTTKSERQREREQVDEGEQVCCCFLSPFLSLSLSLSLPLCVFLLDPYTK